MSHARALDGRKILVVDDSTDMTSLLADVFADAGARVTEANGGEDAMRLMVAEDFDVIFLDLSMPDPDGWAVLQFMQAFHADLLPRTIVLTAHAYGRAEARWPKGIPTAYMLKPFLLTDLMAQACRAIAETGTSCAAV
jgi:CheY-like chemotaxis protein